jgi:hypothetical protein
LSNLRGCKSDLRGTIARVENASGSPLEFLPIVTDPDYSSEAEVERLLGVLWGGGASEAIKAAVMQAPVPDVIARRQNTEGFVFTHREGGLKLFSVGFETGRESVLLEGPSRRSRAPPPA